MVVGGPILVASLLLGLLISLIQAMTQLHDQTLSFVPKLLGLLVLIALCLPWLTDRMAEFSKRSWGRPGMGVAGFPAGRGYTASPAGHRVADRPQSPIESRPPTTPAEPEQSTTPQRSPFQLPQYQFSRPDPDPREG